MGSECTPDDWCCQEGEGKYFCPAHMKGVDALEHELAEVRSAGIDAAFEVTTLEREAIVYQQTIKGILYDKDTLERDVAKWKNRVDVAAESFERLKRENAETENDRDVLMAKLESARRTNAELVAECEQITENLGCMANECDAEDKKINELVAALKMVRSEHTKWGDFDSDDMTPCEGCDWCEQVDAALAKAKENE